MPVFLIVYTKAKENHAIRHELEWVVQRKWTSDQIIKHFNELHKNTTILGFEQIMEADDK